MHPLSLIAERKIQEAQEKGELRDLPGQGRPLELEDLHGVPEDLQMAYKILKNAGYTPAEVADQKELARTEDLLAGLTDEQERLKAIRKINLLMTRINQNRNRPLNIEVEQKYYHRVMDRISRRTDK